MCKEKIKIIKRDEYFNMLNGINPINYIIYNGEVVLIAKQVANYYEVTKKAINTIIERHRDELENYGIKNINGCELKFIKKYNNDIIGNRTSTLNIMPLKSVLLVSFYLQNNKIANIVKNKILENDPELYKELNDKSLGVKYIKRYENEFGYILKSLLGKYNKIDEQVVCGKYRIDFVINNKIAIEVDEYGHNHYDKNEERIREECIKSYDYILYRFNPMKDDMLEFMGEIIQLMKKFNKAIEE